MADMHVNAEGEVGLVFGFVFGPVFIVAQPIAWSKRQVFSLARRVWITGNGFYSRFFIFKKKFLYPVLAKFVK